MILAIPISTLAYAQKPSPIALADLPKPPQRIAALINSGSVTFEAGRRETDAQSAARPRITAETHYRVAYDYHSRSRWNIKRGRREIVINVSYLRIQWRPIHKIWFRDRPASEDFWSNKLVLHEFDHVRVSSDRRLSARFEQLLKSKNVLSRTFRAEDVVNQEFVDRLVDQHVAEVFAEISDLISIRYKELDRVTEHGLRAVPDDSPLNAWLSPD